MGAGSSTTVRHDLEVRLVTAGRAPIPLAVTLTYDSADPYAVHALFRAAAATPPHRAGGDKAGVEWVFARDTLADGVTTPAGQGDVRVWPGAQGANGREVVYLSLSSPDGRALLEAPAEELSAFLIRSFSAVPRGAESRHLDIDATLTALLES